MTAQDGNAATSLFAVGDRVSFTGEGGGTGTVASVRQSEQGWWLYLVAWDDGIGSKVELGEDDLNAREEPMKHDPLHDALVAIFEAIAEREGKTIAEVVAEFVESYERA